MLKFTRIISLLVVIAALAPVSAAGAKTHRYSSKLVSSPLSTSNGYPGVGGIAYMGGSVKTKQFGAAALMDRITITGQPWAANVFTFEGTEAVLSEQGTILSKFTGSSIVLEDGSQEVVANGRITGGTGRFQGATGRYKFRGTVPAGSTTLTGGSRGRLVF